MLANFGSLIGVDGLIILAIGLLIFGRRLPEVGQNVGKIWEKATEAERMLMVGAVFICLVAVLLCGVLARVRW